MYRFAHPQYPELSVPTLGVQFSRGFFETDDPGLAERLSLIDGVVLLDEDADSHTPAENSDAVRSAPVSTATEHAPTLAELESELARLRAEVEHAEPQG